MSNRKTMEHGGGGVSRTGATACGSSLPYGKLLNLFIALVLCCGLMIPTTLTHSQAYADPAEAPIPEQIINDEQMVDDGVNADESAELEANASTFGASDDSDEDATLDDVAELTADEPVAYSSAASEAVCGVDGYQISARHTGTTNDDAVQYVDFVISPDYGEVTVTDEAALAASFKFVNAKGETDGRFASVTATVSEDGDSIVVTGQLGFALTDGVVHLKATAEDGRIAGCTAKTWSAGYVQAPVAFDGIDTVVPSGLAFTAVSYTTGTDKAPASTTFKLTGKANVRSMNHVIWLSNGSSIIPSNGAATNAGYSQTTVAHQHDYLNMDEKAAVASIVSNAYNKEEGSRTLAQYGYSIKDNLDGTFTVTADTAKAGEVIDASVYDDNFLQSHGLNMDTPLDDKTAIESGPAAIVTSEIRGRASSDPATASLSLKNVGEGWAAADKTMKVAVVKDGVATDEQTLAADQWSLKGSTVKVTRTAEAPVFETTSADASADDPYYQSRLYRVTIEADGFPSVTKDITFYTNYNSGTLQVRVKDSSTSAAVSKTVDFTEEQVNNLLEFQNGSSSCGMTGVRTFSGMGVPITTLLEEAGITFEPGDTLKMRCTDGDGTDKYYWRGGSWTYEELLGNQRYFLSSLYTDEAVQDLFIKAATNPEEAPDNTAFRLAAAAAENTKMTPMISTGYVETMLDASNIKDAELPTEASVKDQISSLVGKENNFRFIYGITMTNECTVSFDAGDGIDIKSQTVKGAKQMTSTPEQENTTMNSCYWVVGVDVIKDSYDPDSVKENPTTVTKPADPTREGYTFGGWYADEACTQAFDFAKQVDSDVTLHAKWVENGSGETPTPDPDPEKPTTGTTVDAATGVTASGSVFAADGTAVDSKLSVSEYPATSETYQTLLKKYAPASNLLFKVFDVSLLNLDGAEITDLGADGLTISFPVGSQYNGKEGVVIHLHENADGTVTEQRSAAGQKVVDGKVSISGIKNFSDFVVMVNDTTSTASGTTAPTVLTKTGDSLPIVPIACFGGAAALLLALAVLARRRSGERG